MIKHSLLLSMVFAVAACSGGEHQSRQMEGEANMDVVSITADLETAPVKSDDDAADDPAIWINHEHPENSYIIGTDKKSGLLVYNLDGEIVDYQPYGNENNVDLRQNLTGDQFGGYDTLMASSNRTTNTVDIMTMGPSGKLSFLGTYPTNADPYGLCVGLPADKKALRVLLNYKDGLVQITDVSFDGQEMKYERLAEFTMPGQLEGCVFDDQAQEFFLGQEDGGVWRFPMNNPEGKGELQAEIGPRTGLVIDVEGMDIYHGEHKKTLVVSSQGDFTFVAFDITENSLVPLTKFRIADRPELNIDGVQETDGLAVTNFPLSAKYPEGILVVQDGENEGGIQNFKVIDWLKVGNLLSK
ncbi:phytase [Pseudemcibacter aquimaris]|uniref:phytase n=1 Tax=Pseudemcibacter aquimaris TaxID=2857064 RepID=UPI0020113403|nr:phytase [Pseudemcibacter aquimaris]MCC3862012.1 phytase [Pseudemcibacter aquimaris]WDU58764.1 phytase [Pseudemcibacter aquimaris]